MLAEREGVVAQQLPMEVMVGMEDLLEAAEAAAERVVMGMEVQVVLVVEAEAAAVVV